MVAELAKQLEETETLIVADYRGLTNKGLEALRGRLVEHGARFRIVKNTLTRRAAETAGFDSLLALLEGPTAIAFIESDGDPAAVAKALADTARETKLLALEAGPAGRRVDRRAGRRAEAPARSTSSAVSWPARSLPRSRRWSRSSMRARDSWG